MAWFPASESTPRRVIRFTAGNRTRVCDTGKETSPAPRRYPVDGVFEARIEGVKMKIGKSARLLLAAAPVLTGFLAGCGDFWQAPAGGSTTTSTGASSTVFYVLNRLPATPSSLAR